MDYFEIKTQFTASLIQEMKNRKAFVSLFHESFLRSELAWNGLEPINEGSFCRHRVTKRRG